MKLRFRTRIRPGEGRQTAAAFLAFFGLISGHALLETARDALFLENVPARRLPWVYLGIATLSLAAYLFYQRRTRVSESGRWSLAAWLLAAAAVTFSFWFLVGRARHWVFYALYTWAGVAATLLVVRFWLFVQDRFSVEQAKRLFPFIGAGSATGAIAGTLLASFLTLHFRSRSLLVTSAVVHALTAVAIIAFIPDPPVSAVPRHARRTKRRPQLAEPFRVLLGNGYLRAVFALIFVPTIVFTMIDFIFKRSVAASLPAAGLARFFATTYLGLNVLSLLAQVFLVGWLIRVAGVNRSLAVMPLFIIAAGGGVAAGGGLAAALLLKAVDGTLRYSLHGTSTEVLYVPLASDLRSQIKGYIDSLGHRGGQAFGSLLILGAVAAGWPESALGFAVMGLSVAWCVITLAMRPHYLNLLRSTVSEAKIETQARTQKLDAAALESLFVSLNSPEDSDVLATLDLFVEQNRARVIPALLLYHPSPRVVLKTLDIFEASRRRDALPTLDRILRHPSPEVRAAALRARAALEPDAPLPKRDDDPSPLVRVTAAVLDLAPTSSLRGDASDELQKIARSATAAEGLAIAEAIHSRPSPVFVKTLVALGTHESDAVRCGAARAMRRMPDESFVPALIGMLPDRACRADAHATLVELGGPALRSLEKFWSTEDADAVSRRQLPAAVGQFPAAQSAPVLFERLLHEPDGVVRYRILRTLIALRDKGPDLRLDEEVLREALDQTIAGTVTIIDWKRRLAAGAERSPERKTVIFSLLLSLIDQKVMLDVERVFLLMDLLTPSEDLRMVYRGLRSAAPAVRAGSFELLEHLVEPRWRKPLLAIVEDVPVEEAPPSDGDEPQGAGAAEYEDVLRRILEGGDSGLRCLAAHHAAELGLVSLEPELEFLLGGGGIVEETILRALERLRSAPALEARHGS